MKVKVTRTNVIRLWASKFSEVTIWLTKLQKKESSALFLYHFCEWAHKTPPELLALKEKDAKVSPPPNEVEKLLDDFCGQESDDFKNSEKYNVSIAVKSFFKHNYRDLAKASGVVDYEKVKDYNPQSKELLRRLWNYALNPRDRALIPFVTCTGIAKETLSNLLWGHLEENWESKDLPTIIIGSELLKGHGRGKYKGVKQITFLTPEAKRELLVYKEWIEEKLGRKVTAQDHLWLSTYKPYEPLSYAMLGNSIDTLSNKAKVPFSLHDGRRWINTALEGIGISTNWARKIRGRKVKGEEAPYSQPAVEQLRAKFRDAVPSLEFTSETPTITKEALERITALEKFKDSLTPEQRELYTKSGIKLRKKEHVSEPPKEDETAKDCANGEHCGEDDFKQIGENELLQHLKNGWRIAYKLASGEVIVRKS
jgi:hypothetical protein